MAEGSRLTRPELKVLLIAGFAENAAIGNGQLEPGTAVITKPFAVEIRAARARETFAHA